MRAAAHRIFAMAMLAGAGSPGLAVAQQLEPGHQLEEIVVTADPLSGADTHLAQPVGVITAEELQRRDVRSIGETVSREPGVSSSDFGPAVGRPVIRGMSGGRVRVMEDGIGAMDVSTISADHAVALEPAFARQVEIFRGPSTLLYGSGASGGLVNISTDRILDYVPETTEADLFTRYDSVSEGVTTGGGFSAGRGILALHADGMIRDTDDYDIPGFGSIAPDGDETAGVLANSSVESRSVMGSASLAGDRGFLGFSIGYLANDYGIPGAHGHEHEGEEGEGEGENTGVRIDQAQTRYALHAAIETPAPWIAQLKTQWGYNDYGHDEIEPGGAVGTRFSNEELEGRMELVHEPLGNWNGVLGMQYRDRDFTAIGEEAFLPPAQMDSIAAFVLEKGDYGRWHFDLGARFELQESAAAGSRRDHGVYSLSGGAAWNYADGYEAGVAVTRAQRAPALEELFAAGPHLATSTFEIGDVSLSDETSTNVDIFWHKTTGRLTVSANLFYNQVSDFVYQRETDLNNDGAADRVAADFSGDPAAITDDQKALLLVRHVQEAADFYGFELEADINIFNDHRGDLHLRLWSDYVRAELDSGADLPRITPWRFGGGLEYLRGPWSASLDFMRVNRQDSTAVLETATPGYLMLDAYAGHVLAAGSVEVTLFARGSNLLDAAARRHTSLLKDSAPLPGRSALLGVRISR